MWTFALRQGDLELRGSSLDVVDADERVMQDLTLLVRTTLGSNPYHRRYGSTLPDTVGRAADPSAPARVRSEVLRVLRDYQVVQAQRMAQAQANLREIPFTPAEIIAAIEAVTVARVADTITVKARIRMTDGRVLTVGIDDRGV